MGALTVIVGAEDVLVQRAIDDAVREATERLGEAPERRYVDAGSEDAVARLVDAMSPTLFSDAAVVIVRDCDGISDEATEAIARAIDDLSPEVSLVVVHPGVSKGRRVVNIMKKAGASEIKCAKVKKGRDMLAFTTEEFRRHGRRVSPDAVRTLYDAVGPDLTMLASAAAQLCSDVEEDPIAEEHVRRYFTGMADAQGFRVSDAVWDRRPVDALSDLRWIAETEGRSAIGPGISAALAAGLRSLARVKSMPPSASEADVAAETGIPDWKVRIVRAQAKRWRPDQLASATVRLADLDVALKGGLREGDALDVDQKLQAMDVFVVRTASTAHDG